MVKKYEFHTINEKSHQPGSSDSGNKIEDWNGDWGLGLRIMIRDWDLGLEIGIKD